MVNKGNFLKVINQNLPGKLGQQSGIYTSKIDRIANHTLSFFFILCIHNQFDISLKWKRKNSRKYLNTDKTTALDNVTNELECSCLQPHAFNSSTLGPSANCNQVHTYLHLLKGNSNTSSIKTQKYRQPNFSHVNVSEFSQLSILKNQD